MLEILKNPNVKKYCYDYKAIKVSLSKYNIELSGLVFDLLAKLIGFDPWQAGGSISIAMVPIFIMSYYYGALGGICTGFIIGSVQMVWGNPAGIIGVILDYVLPYTSIGLAGLFINKKYNNTKLVKYILFTLSIIIVGVLRIFWHTLSGVVLYETAWWASLVYNAPYVLISILISAVLTILIIDRLDNLPKKRD